MKPGKLSFVLLSWKVSQRWNVWCISVQVSPWFFRNFLIGGGKLKLIESLDIVFCIWKKVAEYNRFRTNSYAWKKLPIKVSWSETLVFMVVKRKPVLYYRSYQTMHPRVILHQLTQVDQRNNRKPKCNKRQLFDHSETYQSSSNCQLTYLHGRPVLTTSAS